MTTKPAAKTKQSEAHLTLVATPRRTSRLMTPDGIPLDDAFWGNARPPTVAEIKQIRTFGRWKKRAAGKLSDRVSLEVANLREATRVIVYYHYLHRGRTMAQLPYWVLLDGVRVGVLLFSYPRLSVPLFGVKPLNMLEIGRMWLSPDVQGLKVKDSNGKKHAFSVASCAMGKSLRQVREDWAEKYPQLPIVEAVVSWADRVHHEGTIYKAANFEDKGESGGTMHGSAHRPNGGHDQLRPDYVHPKTMYWFKFTYPTRRAQLQGVPAPWGTKNGRRPEPNSK